MKRTLALTVLALAMFRVPASSMTLEERREYLQKLLQILPDVPSFKQWLDKTGALPPDFDSLPRINGLPITRNVRLEFGPQSKGTLRVRLVIPDGKGPFPVLMARASQVGLRRSCAEATSPPAMPPMTRWMMRPRWRSFIPTTIGRSLPAERGSRDSCSIILRRCLRTT